MIIIIIITIMAVKYCKVEKIAAVYKSYNYVSRDYGSYFARARNMEYRLRNRFSYHAFKHFIVWGMYLS